MSKKASKEDRRDVADAERRLADPREKPIPFKAKPPTVKDVAQHLATARAKKVQTEGRVEKAMQELANAISADLDADVELATIEDDFDELAIATARKRFGVEEETPEPQSIGVTFSGITACPCCPPRRDTGAFTFSIAKPTEQLQHEIDSLRFTRCLGK